MQSVTRHLPTFATIGFACDTATATPTARSGVILFVGGIAIATVIVIVIVTIVTAMTSSAQGHKLREVEDPEPDGVCGLPHKQTGQLT
jgi:hypothetical protein